MHWSAAPRHNLKDCFLCAVFWCWVSWWVLFTNSLIKFYFIMIVVTISGIFMAIIFILNCLGFPKQGSSGSANTYLDVSAPGHSLWILDWTCYLRTPLCHVYSPNQHILQGSSIVCNWLSLWRLVPRINHLPPVCWSTFWKSNLKW